MSNLTKSETPTSVSIFNDGGRFEHAQRIAKMLVTSDLVPQSYRNNIPNAMVALEMAGRIGASPLMVMQNLHVISGRPSWSSSFVIAALNSCGRFEPLRFRIEQRGKKTVGQTTFNDMSCVAWTKDRDGNLLEGPEVTVEMAVSEGWYGKTGSKWKTMPDLMIRYRSAKFFGNLYAPDVLMGMQTQDELVDIGIARGSDVDAGVTATASNPIQAINDSLKIAEAVVEEISETQTEPEPEPEPSHEPEVIVFSPDGSDGSDEDDDEPII